MSGPPACWAMRRDSSRWDSHRARWPPSRPPSAFQAGPCVRRMWLESWRALPGVGWPPRLTGPMPTLDNLAARFAQCVSLFRDPSAKAEQKKEFRALLGLLQDAAVTLRLAPGGSGIELNGVPCEAAGLATLVERLDLPGIGEIAPPPNPPPPPLFELLQAPSDPPPPPDAPRRPAPPGAAPHPIPPPR